MAVLNCGAIVGTCIDAAVWDVFNISFTKIGGGGGAVGSMIRCIIFLLVLILMAVRRIVYPVRRVCAVGISSCW